MTEFIEHIGGDELKIDNIFFFYNSLTIFRNFEIDVKPGEFLSIIGPSGCGKTTLLNLLSGFIAPNSVSVLLRGKAMTLEDPHLGYVFQSPTLFPWLTALKNVEFGLKMSGDLSTTECEEKGRHYLALVGLAGFEDYLPAKLSGGM